MAVFIQIKEKKMDKMNLLEPSAPLRISVIVSISKSQAHKWMPWYLTSNIK